MTDFLAAGSTLISGMGFGTNPIAQHVADHIQDPASDVCTATDFCTNKIFGSNDEHEQHHQVINKANRVCLWIEPNVKLMESRFFIRWGQRAERQNNYENESGAKVRSEKRRELTRRGSCSVDCEFEVGEGWYGWSLAMETITRHIQRWVPGESRKRIVDVGMDQKRSESGGNVGAVLERLVKGKMERVIDIVCLYRWQMMQGDGRTYLWSPSRARFGLTDR